MWIQNDIPFSDFDNSYFLELFNMKKRIEGSEITFKINKDKFNKFQTSLPKKNIYWIQMEK